MQKIKLEFNVDQVNIILASLGKQPFEAVAPLINEIQKQATPQLQAEVKLEKPENDPIQEDQIS